MHTKYLLESASRKARSKVEERKQVASIPEAIIEPKRARNRGNMVTIPIFNGAVKADPERFLKQFKRACMANGDRTEDSWLELLPIHLDDEASWWYDSQSVEVKECWDLLTKGLMTEFQERESYQVLMNELNTVKQKEGERVREFSTRVKELRARIIRSQRKTIGVDGVTEVDPAETDATIASRLGRIE